METKKDFDLLAFLDSIIEEMGLQKESPEKVANIRKLMLKQANDAILKEISLNIEPEVIDAVTSRYGDAEDPVFLLSLLIEYSPGSQKAIVEALYKFRRQTLDVFNKLKRK